MTKEVEVYNQFLKMISNIGNKKSLKAIYSNVDDFLKKNNHGRVCTFSMKTKESFNIDKARVLTDQRYFQKYKEEINRLYIDNYKNIKASNPLNKSMGNKLVEFDEHDSQLLYCFFYLNQNFSIFETYLFDFLKIHHKRINQLDEIKNLRKLSDTDDVTGLFNQRKLKNDLKSLISQHKISKENFSLLFIDIDKYKEVNDGYGHVVGTELLKQLGALLTDTIRETDLFYRYGGDEFVVILKDIDEQTSEIVANRFLKKVCNNKFNTLGNDFFLSVSIGIAEFPTHASSAQQILEMADKMMYEAKKNGRGIVCSAKDLI